MMNVGTVLDPLLSDLCSRNLTGLAADLGLDANELHDRLCGVVEFSIPELMSVASWLGQPMSEFLAPFDALFSSRYQLDEGKP